MPTMHSIVARFFFLIVILGAVNADWIYWADQCDNEDRGVASYVMAYNGNCVPNATSAKSWTLASCSKDGESVQQFICSDRNCKKCSLIATYPLGKCVTNSDNYEVIFQCEANEPNYREIFGAGYALKKDFLKRDLNSTVVSTYAMATDYCRDGSNTYCKKNKVITTHYNYQPDCTDALNYEEHTIGKWEGNSVWFPCHS
jgi:hypothetical protein